MVSIRVVVAALFAAVALCACGHQRAPDATASRPPMMIEDRGVTMPLDRAVEKIAFRPYLPPAQIVAFAVIPPLGDLDTKPHRGIAMEYEVQRRAFLLSEWPMQTFKITFLKADITSTPCTVAPYSRNGVAWTTHGSLLLTLQPDGRVSPASVNAEAHRLLGAGGCSCVPTFCLLRFSF